MHAFIKLYLCRIHLLGTILFKGFSLNIKLSSTAFIQYYISRVINLQFSLSSKYGTVYHFLIFSFDTVAQSYLGISALKNESQNKWLHQSCQPRQAWTEDHWKENYNVSICSVKSWQTQCIVPSKKKCFVTLKEIFFCFERKIELTAFPFR